MKHTRQIWLLLLLPLALASLGCNAVMRVVAPGRQIPPTTAPENSPTPWFEPISTPGPEPTPTTAPDATATATATSTVSDTLQITIEVTEVVSPTLPAESGPHSGSNLPTRRPPVSGGPQPTVSPARRQEQLSVFEELWQIVQEQYLYADFNGLDWDAMHVEYRERIEAGLSDEAFYLAMDEMIYRLGDDHSVFLSPEAAAQSDAEYAGENEYVGIGVLTLAVPERKRVTIVLVFKDSPAERSGLKIHDSILAVDGQPILDETGFRRNLLRGPEGSQATLTVVTPGEEPREVELTRQRVGGAIPISYDVLTSPDGRRIGYIFLPTFNDITIGDQVGDALLAMSEAGDLDGIILDNRQNGGGANTVLEDTLAYFTNGLVGHFVSREGREAVRVTGRDLANSQHAPLVVLVSPDTVSFGEIFAGVLKDLGRAQIMGEQTDGNVEILYVFEFKDGSRVWLAHDTFRPVNNSDANWEETGIIPDQIVPAEWDLVTLETDPAVAAAVEYFDTIP